MFICANEVVENPSALSGEQSQALSKFLELIKLANAVSVADGPILLTWDLEEATGEGDNELVRFSWTDVEYDFSCVLTEEGISAGKFAADGAFVCNDREGEVTEVRFFTLNPISA